MKALAIFAHPDDEILWGWPIMQDPQIKKYLLTVSDNHNGYGVHAVEALREVCKLADVRLVDCIGLPSEYYKVATRYKAFTLMREVVPMIISGIRAAIWEVWPDFIITHNPFGEYGNGDHRLLFNIVSTLHETDKITINFTDACQWNRSHLSSETIPRRIVEAYYRNRLDDYELNEDWFVSLQRVYEVHKAWSWSGHEVIKAVGLYTIG